MRDHGLIRSLHRTLERLAYGKRVQIVSHWGGDADSVGASYVLTNLLKDIYQASEVGFIIPEEVSAHVKAIMERIGFAEKIVAEPEVYVLVDVGSLNQLGDLKEVVVSSGKDMIVIDHHLQTREAENLCSIVSPQYQAVSEMVYDLLEFLNLRPDSKTAEALFLGMYYDTVRLSVADKELAVKAATLLSTIDPSKIIGMLEPKIEDAERIARLKALRRMDVFKLGEWFVAASRVNGYLSSVARTLISAGAHVALVAGSKGEYAVVAARSSQDFQKYAGITLGEDLTKYLVARFEGDGGGHAGAARLRLKTSPQTALTEAVKGLSLLLGVNMVELEG
ncbi:MAG: DHH family phosphoesterase [Candidatus Caldarchaeum sp.]|nr:DHH family phosphoesterase [Candidatus Caldarchaeum sp.]